jgi:hypothetical protein
MKNRGVQRGLHPSGKTFFNSLPFPSKGKGIKGIG